MAMSSEKTPGSQKLWGGRFGESTAASVEAFTASIHYDSRLYRYDIAGSKAHAAMLAENGILSREELTAITEGLSAIENEIAQGTFVFRRELEDIHMNIENPWSSASDRPGPSCTARAAATTRWPWISSSICATSATCWWNCWMASVAPLSAGREYLGKVMPGYTHLQRAQPVLISHHMLAYLRCSVATGSRISRLPQAPQSLAPGSGRPGRQRPAHRSRAGGRPWALPG
jgi:argininosuccinate lyase